MAQIGEIIRVLRIKRGLTQAQLADEMHLKRSAIGNYEVGLRVPDLDTIEAFADFFDVSVSDLMGRDDSEPVNPAPAPRTIEARIVSAGMDDLPKEQRERILGVLRAMFINDPDLFKDRKEDQ